MHKNLSVPYVNQEKEIIYEKNVPVVSVNLVLTLLSQKS